MSTSAGPTTISLVVSRRLRRGEGLSRWSRRPDGSGVSVNARRALGLTVAIAITHQFSEAHPLKVPCEPVREVARLRPEGSGPPLRVWAFGHLASRDARSAGARQAGRPRTPTGLGFGDRRLDDPVLARVISDRNASPVGPKGEDRLRPDLCELLELLVDRDPQGLEDPRRRVATPPQRRRCRRAHDLGQLRRARVRPPFDDPPREAPRDPPVAVRDEHRDEVAL